MSKKPLLIADPFPQSWGNIFTNQDRQRLEKIVSIKYSGDDKMADGVFDGALPDAVAVAGQIIDFLKNGTIVNAVNVPSVTGELLKKLGPYLSLGDQIGCLQAQLIKDKFDSIKILSSMLEMDRTRAMIADVGRSVEKDQCTLINGFEAERFAHPWDD